MFGTAPVGSRTEHESAPRPAGRDPGSTVTGRTYAQGAGISPGEGILAPLFQLLSLALLLSARIRAEAAVGAARALFDDGLTTVDKMAASSWGRRTRILNRSGYARYDESTSRMLGQTADL